MFGVVPRVLWEKRNPPDDKNRILMALRSLLIQTGRSNILVDAGIGSKGDKKFHEIYAVDRNPPLEAALASCGLGPQDIHVVINTHLHMDHAGGNTHREAGRAVPSFPRARYIVQEGEWRDATCPNERTRASYIAENFLPLEDSRQIEFVGEEEVEIEKGVFLWRTGGHTPFHQCVRVESDGLVALFLADLIPLTSHMSYPYIQSYDLFPLETLAKKKDLLPKALEEKWLLIFQHDPVVEAGYLKKEDGKFMLGEVVKL
jgi:glyoxylase-like metal-dependent hydrolase (beta-lactamase superfamily II)